MADLPSGSFVAVNDIETAQGAPVSEALAQKSGSNENNLDDRITSNDTDIATNVTNIGTNATNIASNVTNIATNTTAIANILPPEIFTTTLTPAAGSQTINTFASSPTSVVVGSHRGAGGPSETTVVLNQSEGTALVIPLIGGGTLTYTLSGTSLVVSQSGGTPVLTVYVGHGFV